MDPGEAIALLSLLLGGLLLAGGLFGAWALGRMQGERKILDERRDDDTDSGARLARMERTIEAMALDMERMAEAQRFAARRIASNEPRDKPELSSPSPRV